MHVAIICSFILVNVCSPCLSRVLCVNVHAHAHAYVQTTDATREVDRYINFPGQATCYWIGYHALRTMRENAEKSFMEFALQHQHSATKSPQFSLPAFHDLILQSGAVPVTVLQQIVDNLVHDQLCD